MGDYDDFHTMGSALKFKSTHSTVTSHATHLWFVAQDSIMKGPYTTPQIQDKISRRDFSPYDYCWRQGFKEWRPIASVPEIPLDSSREDLPNYPSLEIPGSNRGINLNGPAVVNESPVLESRILRNGFFQKKPRTYVNFKDGKRGAWSIYEWGAAAIFACIVSFLSTSFSLNLVRENFFQLWQTQQAGSVQVLGEPSNSETTSTHPIFWQPMLSAPGLMPLLTKDASGLNPNAPDIKIHAPVTILGVQNPDPKQQSPEIIDESGEKYLIKGNSELWNPARYNIDPIYIRPIQLNGYLSLENTKDIWVHDPSNYVK